MTPIAAFGGSSTHTRSRLPRRRLFEKLRCSTPRDCKFRQPLLGLGDLSAQPGNQLPGSVFLRVETMEEHVTHCRPPPIKPPTAGRCCERDRPHLARKRHSKATGCRRGAPCRISPMQQRGRANPCVERGLAQPQQQCFWGVRHSLCPRRGPGSLGTGFALGGLALRRR